MTKFNSPVYGITLIVLFIQFSIKRFNKSKRENGPNDFESNYETMKEPVFESTIMFIFPIYWLLSSLLMAYLCYYYLIVKFYFTISLLFYLYTQFYGSGLDDLIMNSNQYKKVVD